MKSYTTYWKNVVLIMIVSGLLSFPLAAEAAGRIVYEQDPGYDNGFPADEQTFATADDFRFNQSTFVTNVTWWGGYYNGVVLADNFKIRLYTDNGQQVGGLLLQVFNVGNNALRRPTGSWVASGNPEYQYSFDLPTAFLAEANTRYWLSITNTPRTDRTDWFWETSASLPNLDALHSFRSDPWLLYSGDYPGGVAFQLRGAAILANLDIEPASFPNRVNLKGNTVRVAILSGPAFDAPHQVVKSSLTFGKTGDEQSLFGCSLFPDSPRDVNGDGRVDLICRFFISFTGLQLGDTTGTLNGMTIDDRSLSGTDSVDLYVYP